MKKVMVIFGTRPEAIKMAPLIKQLEHSKFEYIVCNTGQHKEMVEQVLKDFSIEPHENLNVMKQNQTLGELSSELFFKITETLLKHKPDAIFVQGDTTSVMIAALCAFYLKIKVVHVEAGLRSHNNYSPFPEEVNRRVVSVMANLHCAPTQLAYNNLIREGINEDDVFVSGNTVIDAINIIYNDIKNSIYDFLDANVKNALLNNKKIILLTSHRRENLGSGLEHICNAVKKLALDFKELYFVYPVHLNPLVKEEVEKILKDIPNVQLIRPLSYKEMVALMSICCFVMTDSGGIQEEAPTFKKPVLVMREVTERTEGVKAGISKIIGTSVNNIYDETVKLISNPDEYEKMKNSINPYGDGCASLYIVKKLEEIL